MSKSVLVIDTPENCYDCPFGTAYCGELEYVGYCELADCLNYDVILMTEEYLSVLKIAKLQGFTWGRENHLNLIEIPFPNILNFYSSKMVTYRDNERTLYEASEIVEDEEKIKDAVNLVRTFTKYPDRTALTESFIDSLKLLADTVESQMEEVK